MTRIRSDTDFGLTQIRFLSKTFIRVVSSLIVTFILFSQSLTVTIININNCIHYNVKNSICVLLKKKPFLFR